MCTCKFLITKLYWGRNDFHTLSAVGHIDNPKNLPTPHHDKHGYGALFTDSLVWHY
jgi:hypothetical protein